MRKNRLKGIIALIIMFLSLTLMYLYLTLGQEAFTTKSVLVSTTDIEKGTVITNEHFTEKKVRDENILSEGIEAGQISDVIGMASTQFIPANSQVLIRFFEKPGIVVTGEKFVYKIPNNWIYAVPSSIRRSDEVLIYEIDSKIDQGIDQSFSVTVPNTVPGITIESDIDTEMKNVEVENKTENVIENAVENENLPTYKEDTKHQIIMGNKDPIIQTTVIYVKDSANREVVDVDGGKRLDASSQVSSIEIVCTKDDIAKIENKVAEGKKLILVYR